MLRKWLATFSMMILKPRSSRDFAADAIAICSSMLSKKRYHTRAFLSAFDEMLAHVHDAALCRKHLMRFFAYLRLPCHVCRRYTYFTPYRNRRRDEERLRALVKFPRESYEILIHARYTPASLIIAISGIYYATKNWSPYTH